MYKYNVGDRVLVREDLEADTEYGEEHVTFVESMMRHRGEILTIEMKYKDCEDCYKCSGNFWTWSGDMFVGLADDIEPDVTVIIPDTAQLNDRLKAGDNFLDMFTYE